jgi:hypothetical protein
MMVNDDCKLCGGCGWVCEKHSNKPACGGDLCCPCGAGVSKPCSCNACGDEHNPPDASKIFKSVTHVRGKVVN